MSLPVFSPRNSYTGTSLLSTYAYTFKLFSEDDVEVIVRKISTGVQTVLTKTTDYTVTGVLTLTGGQINLVDAGQAWLTTGYLLNTYKIIIRLKKVLKQDTDIKNNTTYYAYIHERQFDKQFQISMTQQDELDRCGKLPSSFSSSDFDPTFPADLIGTPDVPLVSNAAGNGWALGATILSRTIVTGTRGAASAIVAADGIAFAGSYWNNIWFIAGSGGPVTITATNRIADGNVVGQRLTLIGTSDANYVQMADGNNIVTGGMTLRLGNNSVATFIWDGANWILESTNGLTL